MKKESVVLPEMDMVFQPPIARKLQMDCRHCLPIVTPFI